MRQEGKILVGIISIAVIGTGYQLMQTSWNSGYSAPALATDIATADPVSAAPVPDETPSPAPEQQTYEGKIDELPDVAQAVLKFTPADEPDQTNSSSIFERVAEVCGLDDFVGSDDFPGTLRINPPSDHGWVRVTWKPGKCGGIGGASYPNPTLVFEISADQDHLREPGGLDSAAYFLTH